MAPNGKARSKSTIDHLSGADTSYHDFLTHYLKRNKPCILSPSLVLGWPAFEEWRAKPTGALGEHLRVSASFTRLAELYPNHQAPVVITDPVTGEEKERTEMTIARAVHLMQTTSSQVYIKDWHLLRMERQGGNDTIHDPVHTPHLFADDWMNNVRSQEEDDFRFCYAGTAGTKTHLHRDVYTSYSWSTNVVGKKCWRLFPPSVKRHLRRFPNVKTSEMAASVDEMNKAAARKELGHVKDGLAGWPEWHFALASMHEVFQEEGETIFVPSDWYHEVLNITDCISINSNWCNSNNIRSMYRSMCEEIEHIEEALKDVRKMMQHQSNGSDAWNSEWTCTVQQVLTTNAGWGWQGFWEMIDHNMRKPPCSARYRPDYEFVAEQLRPCIDDFEDRADYAVLSEGKTGAAFRRCKEILIE